MRREKLTLSILFIGKPIPFRRRHVWQFTLRFAKPIVRFLGILANFDVEIKGLKGVFLNRWHLRIYIVDVDLRVKKPTWELQGSFVTGSTRSITTRRCRLCVPLKHDKFHCALQGMKPYCISALRHELICVRNRNKLSLAQREWETSSTLEIKKQQLDGDFAYVRDHDQCIFIGTFHSRVKTREFTKLLPRVDQLSN